MMMIDPDAQPLRNIPVYRRIDDRKPVITALELCQSGDREPDPAAYWFDTLRKAWLLKEVYPEPKPMIGPLASWRSHNALLGILTRNAQSMQQVGHDAAMQQMFGPAYRLGFN
jgi:hypothetical protein